MRPLHSEFYKSGVDFTKNNLSTEYVIDLGLGKVDKFQIPDVFSSMISILLFLRAMSDGESSNNRVHSLFSKVERYLEEK